MDISIDRSGEYQTVIKGYDTQTPTENKEDTNFEPLFGELYSNKSDYHQIFLNQNIIDTDNKNLEYPGGRRYDLKLRLIRVNKIKFYSHKK